MFGTLLVEDGELIHLESGVAGKAKPSDLGRYRRGEFFAGCADSVACVGNLSAIIFQYAGCGVIAVVGEIHAVGKNLNLVCSGVTAVRVERAGEILAGNRTVLAGAPDIFRLKLYRRLSCAEELQLADLRAFVSSVAVLELYLKILVGLRRRGEGVCVGLVVFSGQICRGYFGNFLEIAVGAVLCVEPHHVGISVAVGSGVAAGSDRDDAHGGTFGKIEGGG